MKITFLILPVLLCLQSLVYSDTPLEEVHPAFEVATVRPESFQEPIVGMDWLSDGRLVVSTLVEEGFNVDHPGEVWILDGVTGDNPGQVTAERYAEGFTDPLGLTVVDDTVYVCHKFNIVKLIDSDGDGFAETKENITEDFPSSGNFHQFTFGMLYRDGFFYVVLGSRYPAGSEPFGRSTLVRVNKETGEQTRWAGGIRNGNGMAFGPEGEIFVSDNQGEWKPTNNIYHVQEGRFYGFNHPEGEPGFLQGEEVTPPLVRMPWDDVSNSPTQPLYVTSGIFEGQLLVGDHVYGGIQRVYMEKVGEEYQGALFRFTGGLDCGPNRLLYGPNDDIYLGCVGGGTGTAWAWQGIHFGLQRLSAASGSAFEMLAVRSRADGMEIEFSQPVNPSTVTANNISLSSWRYQATEAYGGAPLDSKGHTPSIEIHSSNRMVFLETSELAEGRVVHIDLSRNIVSESGEELWDTEAWYTLNRISDSERFTIPVSPRPRAKFPVYLEYDANGIPIFKFSQDGTYRFSVRDTRGREVYVTSGEGAFEWSANGLPNKGIYFAVIRTARQTMSYKFHVL